jgi:hypothetical protein
MRDSDFDGLPLDTLEPNRCTPAEAPGIHITAPSRSRADGAIPVCGYLEFTYDQLVRFARQFPDPRWDLRLVACAPALGLVRTGALKSEGDDGERTNYEASFIALYFNANLAAESDLVDHTSGVELPDTPATWHVYAYFAGRVSNTVTITVGPRS